MVCESAYVLKQRGASNANRAVFINANYDVMDQFSDTMQCKRRLKAKILSCNI